MSPDRVIFADRVHTVDPENPTAEAIAINGRNLVGVGSRDDAKGWDLSRAEVIDLGGATVTPGFVDAHVHPIMGAECCPQPDDNDCPDPPKANPKEMPELKRRPWS